MLKKQLTMNRHLGKKVSFNLDEKIFQTKMLSEYSKEVGGFHKNSQSLKGKANFRLLYQSCFNENNFLPIYSTITNFKITIMCMCKYVTHNI